METLGEVFLFPLLVLLEGVASKGCFGDGGLNLITANFLVVLVFTIGGVSSKTMLSIRGSFTPYGTISETVGVLAATPLLFLANLGFVE